MKKYFKPEINFVNVDIDDIILLSSGELGVADNDGGAYDNPTEIF